MINTESLINDRYGECLNDLDGDINQVKNLNNWTSWISNVLLSITYSNNLYVTVGFSGTILTYDY